MYKLISLLYKLKKLKYAHLPYCDLKYKKMSIYTAYELALNNGDDVFMFLLVNPYLGEYMKIKDIPENQYYLDLYIN